MATPKEPQKPAARHELAAIMFSDIAGYTALMGHDEDRAMRALDEHRGTLRSLLPEFDGRLIGEIGDGTLSSFHSAIDAVNCARKVQALAQDNPELRLRIGIHLGDVVFTNNTVIGDGVNVASRIHALASPGSIVISAGVFDEVRNKSGIRARDLGTKNLKNVARPVRVYELTLEGTNEHTASPAMGLKLIAAAAGIAAVVAFGIATVKWRFPAPNSAPPSVTSSHAIRSIAVLPLDNYSGDPSQEYFADGMTDELTTDLAKIGALRVISRGSAMRFKGANRPPTPEIAKALNVDAVVEGSVLRLGEKVRITAQLIDAAADRHIWADSFERDSRDVLALEDELASAIAKEIEIQLTPGERNRLTTAPTVNPAAHEAYLKGLYFFARLDDEGLMKAIASFKDATKLDPGFAPAYAGLANAYLWAGTNEGVLTGADAMPQVKSYAQRAIELDGSSAEAHASLATYAFNFDYDWALAEREFRRAIELNPNYAYAHDQFGEMLALRGRLDEALIQNSRAAELDPLSVLVLGDTIFTLTWQRRYDDAKALAHKISELDPTSFYAPWFAGWTDVQAGKFNEAVVELRAAGVMPSAAPFVSAWLGFALGALGDRPKALAMIEEARKRSPHGYVPPFNIALVYLGLGDRSRAMDNLEQAAETHSLWLTFLKMDKVFDPVRSEPRFIALMKKVGFEDR